ncbi:MAG: cysteine hydrolase [Lachnospiraceae bacterium]|nr:cysteine hydrolase [Lachnospiraceae bacterium]
MPKDLLLVIDMQNVYCAGGAWSCPGAEKAAERIRSVIERKGRDMDVIFTRFLASPDPEGVWKDYNRENGEINSDPHANAMMDAFREELERYPLYTKSVYSSLDIPEVREAAGRADRVIVSGVVAECCVLSTVFALIDMGKYVIYLKDGVAGLDIETEKAVEKVLSGLEPLHLKRESCKELQ